MTYFRLVTHKNEKIGQTAYFKLDLARTVAKRTVAQWQRNPEKRGNAIKILRENGSLYPETVEWVGV